MGDPAAVRHHRVIEEVHAFQALQKGDPDFSVLQASRGPMTLLIGGGCGVALRRKSKKKRRLRKMHENVYVYSIHIWASLRGIFWTRWIAIIVLRNRIHFSEQCILPATFYRYRLSIYIYRYIHVYKNKICEYDRNLLIELFNIVQ